MKKILLIFGTRPEAIKMAPLVKEFEKYPLNFDVKVCVTAQHRQMLDQVLDFFDISPDYDLNLMRPGQNLFQLTSDVILGLKNIITECFVPDYVFVHGDTTTSMASALAAFYSGAKICHIEAGLRTYNKLAPFPEEMNRQITARLTDIHFAPTESAKKNLISEGISESVIKVTGNTVIDALLYASEKLKSFVNDEILCLEKTIDFTKKIILVTGHRRENFGDGFVNICDALSDLSKNSDVEIVYPVHLNPNVTDIVYSRLKGISNVKLINPLGYPAFVWLMNKACLILTDSGGVQEEAPSLGKPVLVMRNVTERPEAVDAGTVKLVGTDRRMIVDTINKLITNFDSYQLMQMAHNPYGDGNASSKIVTLLLNEYK